MSAAFLGTGWSFPPRRDAASRIVMSSGEQNIEQAIWTILATAPGERVMRPDFGCGIHRLVFSVNDAATAGAAAEAARVALVRWEPRIDVMSVSAQPGGRGEVLHLDIHYRVRSTNNVFNLVYPFYLARTG